MLRPPCPLLLLCCTLFLLAGQPGAAAPGTPTLSSAATAPDTVGRATSIVPPPPQAVEQLKEEGRPLPDLSRYKLSPSPVQPREFQGQARLLAILVDYTGTPGTVTSLGVFDNLIFALPVGGRGSVRDYYDEVSRSRLDIVTANLPSTTGWRATGNTMAYFANGQYGMGLSYPQNAAGMVAAVLSALDPLVNFANYDNNGDGQVDTLLVIHAGTGAEWSTNPNHIWSHASSLSAMGGVPYYSTDGVSVDRYVTVPEYWEPGLVGPGTTDMTVGVICHEIAHGLFGLPDLYDLDITSYGIGQWALMSYGDWNGPAKWNSFIGQWVTDGSSPAWPEAWSRVLLGWDTPTLVMGSMDNVCLPPVEQNPNVVYRFKSTGLRSQEYFLVENRQQIGNTYDQYLPGAGLLIWHVDEAAWSIYGGPDNNSECTTTPHCSGSCTSSHYLVSLEQADGLDNLEHGTNLGDTGDPFPGSSNNTSWRYYGDNPVNPESGTWYDTNCSSDSCIDLTGIASSPPAICFDILTAQCAAAEADLGDAPASDNNHGNIAMTAYHFPAVQAHFPTVFQSSVPATGQGPRHHFARVDSWLGAATTVEVNADQPPDQDGPANISPTIDIADLDSIIYSGDDGLRLPLTIAHCHTTTMPFTVTVANPPIFGLMPRYVNLWADWTRDGDWDDIAPCLGGPSADEWIFHNMKLSLPMGTYSLYLGSFTTKATVSEGNPYEIWLRLSIADMPAPGPADGRGPNRGYDLGETEDYYLVLSPTLQISLSPSSPSGGQPITYTIRYGGVGEILAKGVVISDVLPQGIEFLSASPPPDLYNPGTRTAHWTADLDPRAAGTIQLTAMVTGNPGDTIVNPVFLLWGETTWLQTSYAFQVGSAGCVSLTGVVLSGPPSLEVSMEGVYHATPQPISATNPIYTWDNGAVGASAVYSWTMAGTYEVLLTASNCYGAVVTDTFPVLVTTECISLSGVAVSGPATLGVGEVGKYLATPTPFTATNPTYLWSNGSCGPEALYSWPWPGDYTVVVTATNCLGVTVSDTFPVVVTAGPYRIYLPLVRRGL